MSTNKSVTKVTKKEAEVLSEGIVFSFVKKCPHLVEGELEFLKKTVKDYLTRGISCDRDYCRWLEHKNWTK